MPARSIPTTQKPSAGCPATAAMPKDTAVISGTATMASAMPRPVR